MSINIYFCAPARNLTNLPLLAESTVMAVRAALNRRKSELKQLQVKNRKQLSSLTWFDLFQLYFPVRTQEFDRR